MQFFFGNKVEKFVAPKKGRTHALYLVREMLTADSSATVTDLDTAIQFFNNTSRQRSIAFIISDFLADDYAEDLKIIGRKHDVVGLKVYDKMDLQLPDVGLMQSKDAETGKIKWIDTSSKQARYNYQQHFLKKTEETKRNFLKSGADLLHIRTDDDYVKILQQFFHKRKPK